VLLGVDGRSDFNGLHSRRHVAEVEFYAFDMLVSNGENLRKLPLSMRKTNLARLLARRVEGRLADAGHVLNPVPGNRGKHHVQVLAARKGRDTCPSPQEYSGLSRRSLAKTARTVARKKESGRTSARGRAAAEPTHFRSA